MTLQSFFPVFQISKTLLTNCLTFTSDVINGKLENAKKENEFVYHEKVPDFDSLPGKSKKLLRFDEKTFVLPLMTSRKFDPLNIVGI